MPVKRRLHKARPHRITPEAIAAFEIGDHAALHAALGLKPWQVSPLEVGPDEPSPWPVGSAGAGLWPLAQELRQKLEATSKVVYAWHRIVER